MFVAAAENLPKHLANRLRGKCECLLSSPNNNLCKVQACVEHIQRRNISQPADWWAAFEQQAEAEGMTLSAWLGDAAKAKLPPKVVKTLTARPPANRPKQK